MYKLLCRYVTALCLSLSILLLSVAPVFSLTQVVEEETVVFAIDEKSYTKGGKVIETDVAPYIKNGRTMVPVAFLAPALGTDPAQWFPSDRMVLITKGENRIAIFIDSKELLVNGKKMQMDVVAEIVDIGGGGGRTMLPIAFIARALEVGYEWIADTRTVHFYGKNVIYDKAGTFGPDFGTEVIEGNVIVKAPGVKLQNLTIKGNLTIAEEVGDGDVYLTNVRVNGETYIRGGGADSIHIDGGSFKNITIQNVGGQVRVVATNVEGMRVVIAEDAKGEQIVLEGSFEKVTIEAPEVQIVTKGNTNIAQLEVRKQASKAKIELAKETVVKTMTIEVKVDVKGEGTIEKAEVKANEVTFQTTPKEMNVATTVTTPPTPTNPSPPAPSTSSGGSGGSTPTSVSVITVEGDGGATTIMTSGGTLQMSADVTPTNASNKGVTWSVEMGTGTATIGSTGLLTALTNGTVTVIATAQDGSGVSGQVEIMILNQVDRSALATAITDAENNKNSIAVSTDGSDVLITEQWVDQAAIDAYTIAIATAQGAYDDNDSTQAVVDQAVSDLAAATITFNNGKGFGTLKATPVVTTPVTATAVNAGDPLGNSTLAGAFEDPNTAANVSGTFSWNEGDATVVNETASYNWTFMPTDTANYNIVTGSVEVVALADKTALATAITDAESNKNSVAVSTDGSEVLTTQQWVDQAAIDAYTIAIATAQGAYDDNDSTQAVVDQAVSDLAAATITFNNGKGFGTLKATPVVTTPVTATAVNAGDPLGNSTLAGAFEDPNTAANVSGTFSWNEGDATVVNETASYNWTFMPTDTANYNIVTGSVEVVALADKTALATAITNAESNKNSVAVSTDGSDVLTTQQWVSQAAMDTYVAAIGVAQGTYDNPNADQVTVDGAVIELAAATSTFNDAKTTGTLIVAPEGQLLDAKAGTNFIGMLYSRDGNIYYNQVDLHGTWQSESLVGTGIEGRMVIDSTGKPHVAYTTSDEKIGYRMYNGVEWVTDLIESNHGGVCKWPSIDIDTSNNPRITYVDTMGDTAGTTNQPDVMYAYKNNGEFIKQFIYSGYYDSNSKYGSYSAEKKPLIAIDTNNNRYVFYQWRTYSHYMNVYHDRGISVTGTNTQSLGSIGSNTNRFDIYDFKQVDGKLYALYRDNTQIKASEMSINTNGEIAGPIDKVAFAASSAYSLAINNNDIVIGSKDGSNLRAHYNGTAQTFNEVTVKGDAVSIVHVGGKFYAAYTDNNDSMVKVLEIRQTLD